MGGTVFREQFVSTEELLICKLRLQNSSSSAGGKYTRQRAQLNFVYSTCDIWIHMVGLDVNVGFNVALLHGYIEMIDAMLPCGANG